MYSGLTDEGTDTSAYSAWKPFPKFFHQITQQKLREIDVERQVSRKWHTRDQKATVLKVGRWFIVREHWDFEKLQQIFKADHKRCRPTYDSYPLFLEDKSANSRAWTSQEVLQHMNSIAKTRTLRLGCFELNAAEFEA
jgi:hypothetical protein